MKIKMGSMDKIIISGLEVFYRIGVTEAERANLQRLLVTVEMATDFKSAAGQDNLAETIDYAAVSERILEFGKNRSWNLIETLATELAEMILEGFSPRQVSVQVKKFSIPKAAFVAVTLTRPR